MEIVQHMVFFGKAEGPAQHSSGSRSAPESSLSSAIEAGAVAKAY